MKEHLFLGVAFLLAAAIGAVGQATINTNCTSNCPSNVTWFWTNPTLATSGTPANSATLNIQGSYWSGTTLSSQPDYWSIQDIMSNAAYNPASTLNLSHLAHSQDEYIREYIS